MTSSIRLKKVTSDKRLNELYGEEDYYWYLHCPEFERRFLKPLGSLVDQLGSCCLDVGCGEGWLCDHIDTSQYYGIDASEKAIQTARRLHPEGTFDVARFETYANESDRTFAVVIFGGLLWLHVEPDSYVPLLQMYAERFCTTYIVVYDLVPLQTEVIERHFNLVREFQDYADVPKIKKIKRRRKIQVYAC